LHIRKFRVQGSEFRVQSLEFRVQSSKFKVEQNRIKNTVPGNGEFFGVFILNEIIHSKACSLSSAL